MTAHEEMKVFFGKLALPQEQELKAIQDIQREAEGIFNAKRNPFDSDELTAEYALRKAFLTWKKVKAPAPAQQAEKPNFETLCQYIESGFRLYPFHFYQKDGKEHSGFCNIHGYGTKQENAGIETKEQLKSFIEAGIENFKFMPSERGYICIDIDRGHSDGIDGVRMFLSFLQKIKAEKKDIYRQIEELTFPTFTSTPSGGIHLYFQSNFLAGKTFVNPCRNAETKCGKLNLTAAGSVKHGRQYRLHGRLDEAPNLPLFLLSHLTKDKTEIPRPQFRGENQQKKSYSMEQLAEYGRKNAEQNGHFDNEKHWLCIYIGRRMIQEGIPKSHIAEFLKTYGATKEHDHSDIETCINSL